MSEAAIDRARDYTWSQLSSEMLDIYQSVLGQRETEQAENERIDFHPRRNPLTVSAGTRRLAPANLVRSQKVELPR